jgi:hypothetical protein
MNPSCSLLVSRGEITVRGTLSTEQQAGCVAIILTTGARRQSAAPATDGTYVFSFTSRRRLLWATLSLADARGRTRRLRHLLIWNRPAITVNPLPEASATALRFIISDAFDAAFYLSRLSAEQRHSATLDPLGHYLSTGWKLGLAPHPWFDVNWYLRENPSLLAAGHEPFGHYLSEGWKRERHPHPGFDNTFYLSRHPELMLGKLSPLHRWNMHLSPDDVRAYTPCASPSPSDFPRSRPYPHPAPEEMLARVAAYRRDRRPGNTVAYFTCITGDYDTLRLPEHLSAEIDYHVFTDQPVSGYGVFQVHPVGMLGLSDPTRRARHIKLHPHTLMAGYDVVVFGDANVIIRGDLMPHVRRFRESGSPLAFVPHPARHCLYEEAVICVACERDSAERIVPQMLAYQQEGFPAGAGLSESNLFACRPADPATPAFFEAWWTELERGSRRDQLSAHYVLWKLGLNPHPLLGPGGNTRNHPDVARADHGIYDAPAFAHLIDSHAPGNG